MKKLFITAFAVSLSMSLANAEKEYEFDFAVSERLRYDAREEFAQGYNDDMADLVNRLIIDGTFSYKESFELFVSGNDAREWTDGTVGRRYEDSLDLNQAYININNLPLLLPDAKLGRQRLIFGKKRVVSSPTWGNKIRTFDAARFDFKTSIIQSTLFGGNLVKFEDDHFNQSSDNEQLTGFYNVITPSEPLTIDLYIFNRRKKEITEADQEVTDERYSTGARLNYKVAKTEVDIEFIYQYGDNKDKEEIEAHAVAFFVKQSIDFPLDPWVKIEANMATGDNNPNDNKNETFMVPYQTMHGPYGIIDYFKLQNMQELALVGSFNPSDKIRIQPELHWYWIENKNDDWYKNSGKTFIEDNLIDDSYAGAEASLIASYAATDWMQVDAGYSVFMPGAASDKVTSDPVHYGYLQAKISY